MATLSELFEIDPEQLTDEHKWEIVDKLRESRTLWVKEQTTQRATKGRASGKMPKGSGKIKSILELGLDEIEI